jgi:hypothetical protein
MELTGAPMEWRALCDLGEHLLSGLGEHHLHEAASNPSEQDGRGEHLWLRAAWIERKAACLGGRRRDGRWSARRGMGAPRVSRRQGGEDGAMKPHASEWKISLFFLEKVAGQ